MGEPYESLDAKQMREITGSSYYQGGLFTPGTAMIQPAMYIRGVADGLRQDGVTIFENSPVTALNNDRNWIVETPQGQVSSPRVILAVNGHLNSFGYAKSRL